MAMTYDEFLKVAGKKYELDWRKYRRRSARRHVRERLQELGKSNYEEYLDYLDSSPEEVVFLPDLMRVTVSRFFREPECWDRLAAEVLPSLWKASGEEPLRCWCVGCCNGEEPYSLALLFLRDFSASGRGKRKSIEILATDIDEKVLARARNGCYDEHSLRQIPAEIRAEFFYSKGALGCVDERARRLVEFKTHNFMEDPLSDGMDLILCRYYVFTYYLGGRRRRALNKLWRALRPGGVLMTGRKEGLEPDVEGLFERWPGTEVIYRKKM